MEQALGWADEHIKIMQLRIEHQNERITKLKESGEDTAEATRILATLLKAMDEMRLQLGMLAPTALDIRRSAR